MSGSWGKTRLFSKVDETGDESWWTEYSAAEIASMKLTGQRKAAKRQKRLMKIEKSIWGDVSAQASRKESGEGIPRQPTEEEDWRTRRKRSIRRELSSHPTMNDVDCWSGRSDFNTQKESTEHSSKMEGVICGDEPLEAEEVAWTDLPTCGEVGKSIWGPKPFDCPTTQPLSFPPSSEETLQASSNADPTQIKVNNINSNFKDTQGPSTATTPLQFSLLLSLPTELQRDIIDLLPTQDTLILRITCQHLYTLIPPPSHTALLALERTHWAVARRLWACALCLRLRRSRTFADTMVRGSRGLNGKEPHKRFCVECGLRPDPVTRASRYAPGSEIIVAGCRHVFCRECRTYGRDLGGRGTGVCAGCHMKLGLGGAVRGVETGVNPGREKRARRGWRRRADWGEDPYGYESDGYELPDEYDGDFWESYDPSY